jgi:flagellar hook-length control protein FliK
MAGKEEMKILLKPEQLGWLKVKISVEGQRVVAHFSAENEFVRSLLESNMNQLQQALQNQNLKVTQISIDVADQNSGQQASQPHGHDQRGKANPALDGDHIEEAILAAELEAIQLTAVDMRV